MKALVTRRSSPAEVMVERLRNALSAKGVALRDHDGVSASSGHVIDVLNDDRGLLVEGLHMPVAVEPSGKFARAVLPVVDGSDLVAWIDVVHDPDWVPDARSSALMRVFARLSGHLVVARTQQGTSASEDQIVLEGARAITELALNADDYEQIIGGIMAVINALVECSKVGIALVNEHGYLQAIPGSFGATPEMVASSQVRVSEAPTAAGEVYRTGRTVIANVPHRDIPRFVEWVEGFGIDRLMTLPMIVAGSRRGVIHVANKASDFTPGDARRAERIASFVAGAVEQVRQRLEMRRKESLAVAVSRAATAVAAGERLPQVEIFLEDLRRVLGARVVVIKSGDGSAPVVVGPISDDGAVEREFMDGINTAAVAERTSMSRPLAPSELGSATLQTPILVGGEASATLAILRVPCVPFEADERAAVRRMSNIVALAWTTDRYRREQAETARMRQHQEIADDIHDHVAQILFSGKIALESVLSTLDDGDAAMPGVLRARDLLVRSEVAIRDMIHRLSSERDELPDLADQLRLVAGEVAEQFDTSVRVEVDTTRIHLANRMPGDVRAAVLAAAREAMVNAAKHAGPCRIDVTAYVTPQHQLTLRVVDDGPGAESYVPGFGLESIHRKLARHGLTFRLRANRTGGSTFLVQVPLDNGRD